MIFEEDKHWADFEMNLRRELVRRNIPVPRLRHISIDTTPSAKAERAKRLELPLALGRLFFYSGIPDLEACNRVAMRDDEGYHQTVSIECHAWAWFLSPI